MTIPKDSYAEAKLKAADSFDGECTPLEALWFYRGSDFGRAYSLMEHEAEIEELKSKLSASEWVRKDNALRTYDGLTEKLQSSREIIATLEEALKGNSALIDMINGLPDSASVYDWLDEIKNDAEEALTALKEWKEKQK